MTTVTMTVDLLLYNLWTNCLEVVW